MVADIPDLAALALWAYLVIGGMAVVDAVFPVVPSETLVIIGASLAAQGDMDPFALLVVAAVGALTGDLTSFALGRRARRRWRDPAHVRGRLGRALARASDRFDRDGESVVIAARFVPGGRTATTFSAGYLGHPTRRFARSAAIGAVLWSLNGVTLGYIGGHLSEDPVISVAGGLALALVATGALHLGRRILARRRAATATLSDRAPVPSRSPSRSRAGATEGASPVLSPPSLALPRAARTVGPAPASVPEPVPGRGP